MHWGINCGMGPEQMMPILHEILEYTSLPVIVKPNAGLPKQRDGETYYDVEPEQFAKTMEMIVETGACVIGGCCGTTPDHIRAMIAQCKDLLIKHRRKKVHYDRIFLRTGSDAWYGIQDHRRTDQSDGKEEVQTGAQRS